MLDRMNADTTPSDDLAAFEPELGLTEEQKHALEVAGKMEMLRSLHIVTDRDIAITTALSRLFKIGDDGKPSYQPVLFTGETETQGITLIEGSGGGKTTAIIKTLKAFEPLVLNEETGLPRYLHVKVESPASLRSLGCSILEKLGVGKVSDRTKAYDIWAMARHRLGVAGIRLLWLDEAQDMFRSVSATEIDSMFKTLKSLMQGDHPVVLLLSGTDRLSAMTGLDPQINRRFTKIRPRPLKFGEDTDRLSKLVRGFARKAGLDVDVPRDHYDRLMRAGRHRFGRCIELILQSIEIALQDRVKTLTLDHFAMAFSQKESLPDDKNIFTDFAWEQISLPDEDDEVYEAERVAAQQASKTRKRKKAA